MAKSTRRDPLSRERVLRAAIELADEAGIGALSMRRLAQRLGVEAMSLYNHVDNKEDLLAGIADRVVEEIELPRADLAWKAAIRATALSFHDVLVRHPWAPGLLLAPRRYLGAQMRYNDAILRTFREGGFSAHLTDHAYHALDSHIYGFTLWLVGMNLDTSRLEDLADDFLAGVPSGEYPYLVEHVHQHLQPRDPDDEGEFAFGLDLILDGLERHLAAERGSLRPTSRAPGASG
jgi:AcrR family transcriptional regulator